MWQVQKQELMTEVHVDVDTRYMYLHVKIDVRYDNDDS